MFRFLHTADLHLDSPLRGLAAREDVGSQVLLGASRKAFENLISLAISEKVDFLVIAGDVYDGDWKGYETGLFFVRGMARLLRAGIPVYLISGNHDAASVITKTLALPENVSVFSSRSPSTHTLDRWPVAIHGMSFPRRAVDENLVPKYPPPVDGKFNIGLLHTSLAGREGHDTYAPCSVDDLVSKGYHYWALGHIHQPEIIHETPWIVYPGNIQGRHSRETGPRGCRIVTVDDDLAVTDCAWHSLDIARWEVLTIDAAGLDAREALYDHIRSSVSNAINEAEERLLALRLVISGVTALHGTLLSHQDQFEAEVQAILESFGSELVWLEKIQLKTRPLIDLKELAESDELTRIVLEAQIANPSALADSEAISSLFKTLPSPLRSELQEDWNGSAQTAIYEDAQAIILDRLRTKGGES